MKIKHISFTTLVALSSLGASSLSFALTALNDEQMSNTTGQSLINVSTIMPGENNNPFSDIGYYKVGVPGTLNLNASIRKLQLGCGGANGPNGCDLDIDYLRFLGQGAMTPGQRDASGNLVSNPNNGQPINDAGPSTDFQMINPFIEMAFENPESLTDRKLVGIRVGAEQALGLLSIGTRPTDPNTGEPVQSRVTVNGIPQEDPSQHTGINSLSGSIGRLAVDGYTSVTLVDNIDPTSGFKIESEFYNVFSSRADKLRLKPVLANVLGVRQIDFLNDLRLVHNMYVNDWNYDSSGNRTTIKPAGNFYISLSGMGDNEVWVKSNGNRSYAREARLPANSNGEFPYGSADNVVNTFRAGADDVDSVDRWLQWNTGVADDEPQSVKQWVPASLGWSMRVPSVEVRDFETGVIDNIRISKPNYVDYGAVTNVDLLQTPADNCYGQLNFC